MNARTLSIFTGALMIFGLGQMALGEAPTPEGGTSGTAVSTYVFRYTTGLSKVMLETMTFAETQPVNLGQCQSVEKVNGPIACTTTCQGLPLCLLIFEGPAGLQSTQIIEKVKEERSSGRPTAPPSPTPAEEGSESTLRERIQN